MPFSVPVTSPSYQSLKALVFKACSLSLWRNAVSVTSTLTRPSQPHSRHPICISLVHKHSHVLETEEGKMRGCSMKSYHLCVALLTTATSTSPNGDLSTQLPPFVGELLPPSSSLISCCCNFVDLIIQQHAVFWILFSLSKLKGLGWGFKRDVWDRVWECRGSSILPLSLLLATGH